MHLFGQNKGRKPARPWRSGRAFVGAAAGVTALSVLAGCGGSNGDGGNSGDTRAASINAVQGARRLLTLFYIGSDLTGTGTGGDARTGAPGRAAAAAKIARWSRERVTQAFQARRSVRTGQKAGRQTGDGLQYDPDLGLYYQQTSATDTSLRYDYFSDQTGQAGAGFLEFNFPDNPDAYPQTATLNYQITTGEQPGSGTVRFQVNNPDDLSSRTTGNITNPETGVRTTFNLSTSASGALSGTVQVSDNDGSVTFSNFDLSSENGYRADLRTGDGSGQVVENGDSSGTLTLSGSRGTVSAAWNPDGAGTLTNVDGSVETVTDFDHVP